jgi:hypothetical protein
MWPLCLALMQGVRISGGAACYKPAAPSGAEPQEAQQVATRRGLQCAELAKGALFMCLA